MPGFAGRNCGRPASSDVLSPGSICSRYSVIRHRLCRPRRTGDGSRRTDWPSVSILHAIGATQSDEAQRGGQLFGVLQLRGLAKVHRRAGVDQGEEVQVFFFQEHLQEQLVQPRVHIPIDESQVVAGDVVAEVGELDTLTLAPAASFALHPTAKDLAADQFQPFQLNEQFGG